MLRSSSTPSSVVQSLEQADGAMLELLRNPRPGREESDAAVIRELIDNYGDKPGISKTTLEARFAEARRRLSAT